MDAESINYITTVKEERNQIVLHQKSRSNTLGDVLESHQAIGPTRLL